ncbi:MAG TPA: hypothetical protein DIV57_14165 [Stenotrophomonas sp.]|nr:hypothetical protein DCO49_01690 [Stenotrophomonas sp. SPM]HCR34499.1 hypothetical protein [Stenotrophomonas sp.]
MGAYHGVHGPRQFSHRKAVVVQAKDGASNLRLRAPYAERFGSLDKVLGNAVKRLPWQIDGAKLARTHRAVPALTDPWRTPWILRPSPPCRSSPP